MKVKYFRLSIVAIVALLIAVPTMLVAAQSLDPSQPPNYGSVSLTSGFAPDPFTVNVTSGGSTSIATALGGTCRGYSTSAPDFRVNYTAGSFNMLSFYVTSTGDTTLVVNAADGSFYCDDDTGDGLNGLINIANPSSGVYDIWVGSFSSTSFISSTLNISELNSTGNNTNSNSNNNNSNNNNNNSSSTTLDATSNPNFGSVALDSGFTPDPFDVDITSGGSISVAEAVDNSCRGFVTSAPDFRVEYDAGNFDNLYFYVEADDDTTLLVLDAEGDFYCDDDSGDSLNPLINIANPSSGIYDIWVGSFADDEFVDSTLFISEVGVSGSSNSNNSNNSNNNNNNSSSTTLDATSNPNFGSVALDSGFTPDPFEVDITSGGSISVAEAVDNSCRGFVTSAPDFRVEYDAGNFDNLYFYVEADDDTTLLVLDAEGDFYCDDDSGDGLNPLINIANPSSGVYDIWVGSFADDEFVDSTLFISEVGISSSSNNSNNNSNNNTNSNSSTVDASRNPNYGSVALDSGFTPDPFAIDITSGGSISVAEAVDNSCRGFVTSAPDFRVEYDAGNFDNLYFYVEADDDTTLLVLDPNGDFYCDDDSGEGLNPLINIANPDSGLYDIWVGSYASGEFISSTLFVSELTP